MNGNRARDRPGMQHSACRLVKQLSQHECVHRESFDCSEDGDRMWVNAGGCRGRFACGEQLQVRCGDHQSPQGQTCGCRPWSRGVSTNASSFKEGSVGRGKWCTFRDSADGQWEPWADGASSPYYSVLEEWSRARSRDASDALFTRRSPDHVRSLRYKRSHCTVIDPWETAYALRITGVNVIGDSVARQLAHILRLVYPLTQYCPIRLWDERTYAACSAALQRNVKVSCRRTRPTLVFFGMWYNIINCTGWDPSTCAKQASPATFREHLQRFLQVREHNTFWVEPTPQHCGTHGAWDGRKTMLDMRVFEKTDDIQKHPNFTWRRDISQAVLHGIPQVSSHQLFAPRADSHQPDSAKAHYLAGVQPRTDCTHWGLDTAAWFEFVRYVITLLETHVQRLCPGTPSPLGRSERCDCAGDPR